MRFGACTASNIAHDLTSCHNFSSHLDSPDSVISMATALYLLCNVTLWSEGDESLSSIHDRNASSRSIANCCFPCVLRSETTATLSLRCWCQATNIKVLRASEFAPDRCDSNTVMCFACLARRSGWLTDSTQPSLDKGQTTLFQTRAAENPRRPHHRASSASTLC
jgi:hypothetical protein